MPKEVREWEDVKMQKKISKSVQSCFQHPKNEIQKLNMPKKTHENYPALRVPPGGNQVDGLPPAFSVVSPPDRVDSYSVLLFEMRMGHPALRVTSVKKLFKINQFFH